MSKLYQCPSYAKPISGEAKSCPKCGKKLDDNWHQEAKKDSDKGIYAFVGIVGVFILLILIVTNIKKPKTIRVSSKSENITAAEYGSQWPYASYTYGIISCSIRAFGGASRPVVTIKLGGTLYGLNGAAQGVGGYPDDRDLMKRDITTGLYELGASDKILKRALALCQQ